jgi:TRAP-type C4-dicarboxylate transport system permease small subunit
MILKTLDVLTKIEKFIASIFIFALTILVLVDVGAREIAETGIPWAQKSAVYMMIWAGFLGAVLVTHKVEHLRPEVADKLWKGKSKIWSMRIQNLLVFIFCLMMLQASIKYVLESKEFGDENIIINMPMWILQLVIPYCFLSMSLRYFYFIFSPKEKNPEAVH